MDRMGSTSNSELSPVGVLRFGGKSKITACFFTSLPFFVTKPKVSRNVFKQGSGRGRGSSNGSLLKAYGVGSGVVL